MGGDDFDQYRRLFFHMWNKSGALSGPGSYRGPSRSCKPAIVLISIMGRALPRIHV